MTLSGGDWRYCFHCCARLRFVWRNEDLLFVCPQCNQPEGYGSLVTEEMIMEQREQQIDLEENPTIGAHLRKWRYVAGVLAALLCGPAWGDLAVTEDALAGDYSLAVWPNDNLKKSFVQKVFAEDLDSIRASFLFNMDQAELVPNRQQHIWQIQRADDNSWAVRVTVQYAARVDTYRIRAIARHVGGVTKTAFVPLPQKDGTYEVEVAWAADGILSIEVDGVKREKAPVADWISPTINKMRLGAPLNTKFFTGTLRFDGVEVWRQ